MNRLIILAAALALSACGQNQPPESATAPEAEAAPPVAAAVTASDPWCRPAAAGAGAAGCYVTLTAAADDRLTAASSPAGERVEIHTMTTEGGIMRMRELPDGLPLPAGESVALRPGAEHLMLMAPATALNEGESVEITLTFEKAPAQTLTAQIRSAPHGMGH